MDKAILRYLDGDASQADVAALQTWLAASPANAARMARFALVESHLDEAAKAVAFHKDRAAAHGENNAANFELKEDDWHALAEQEAIANAPLQVVDLADDASGKRLKPSDRKRGDAFHSPSHSTAHSASQPNSRNQGFSLGPIHISRTDQGNVTPKKLVAAMLLFCLTAWVVLHTNKTPEPTATPPVAVQAAQIDWSLDAVWEDRGRRIAIADGKALAPGRHRLAQGFVQLVLVGGTQVLVEAPAEFELSQHNRMVLADGALTAEVPEQAIGFVVRVGDVDVTDLSTSFGVKTQADGELLAAVFDGHIALSAGKTSTNNASIGGQEVGNTDATPRVLVAAGQQLKANKDGRIQAQPEAYQPEQLFVRNWMQAAYQPEAMSGALRFLETVPPSVDYDARPDVWPVCFLEQPALVLQQALDRVMTDPSTAVGNGLKTQPGRVAAGTKVDCYFVHYDPPGQTQTDPVDFQIVMPRPIVAVVPTIDGLLQLQKNLPNTGRTFPNPFENPMAVGIGLEADAENKMIDRVTIGPDRRTLTVRMHAGPALDQIRILIEPAPAPAPGNGNGSLERHSSGNARGVR